MVARLHTIRRKLAKKQKLGFSERARAVNKGLIPSKAKKKEENIMFWVYVAEYLARRQKYEYRCFEGRDCRRRGMRHEDIQRSSWILNLWDWAFGKKDRRRTRICCRYTCF